MSLQEENTVVASLRDVSGRFSRRADNGATSGATPPSLRQMKNYSQDLGVGLGQRRWRLAVILTSLGDIVASADKATRFTMLLIRQLTSYYLLTGVRSLCRIYYFV
ncbi:hypothetical protein R5R35_008362 [Gryllus longicercus]|uniref:Uncharacterized protein n=1 Tax=Gryllus longicercus TaxID=2509291 RepID=A0AAN9Z9T1_9ORTH